MNITKALRPRVRKPSFILFSKRMKVMRNVVIIRLFLQFYLETDACDHTLKFT